MGNSRGVLRLINQFTSMSARYKRIKENENKRPKSFFFAMSCIIYSIFAAALVFGGIWLLKNFDDTALVLFFIIFGVALLLCGAIMLVWSIIALIYQFCLNRNFFPWFALIVFIASIGISVYGILQLKL